MTPFRRRLLPHLAILGIAVIFVTRALASDIVFLDGKSLRGVAVIQGQGYVIMSLPQGSVRFPHSTIKSIDGKPPELFGVDARPAAVAEAQPELPATPEQLPSNVPTEPAEPVNPPAEADDVAVAPPTPEPAPPLARVKVTPADEPSMVVTRTYEWSMELALLAFLIVAGVWIYGLRWVQDDLEKNGGSVRVWTMLALLLPGLGALIYLAFKAIQGKRAVRDIRPPPLETQIEPAETEAPAKGGGGFKFPWLPKPDLKSLGSNKKSKLEDFEFLDVDRKSIAVKDGELSSGLQYGREMLQQAVEERASDVHIEPSTDDYRVRFRLDGVMHERISYDSTIGRRLVTALKSLAEIDVSERRKAQDGRFRGRMGNRDVDFRVATANSINGEKMVIRLLDHGSGIFDLTSLGMSAEMLATFQNVIHSRNGMILATGPTGSGKTSTLYAALRQLDAQKLNIMTIEDPAEYELEGATQIAVNPKAGITYESGLRSILRQDPDVILVGEMRDMEATQVALRAALTGHLVLSSLHTKDAISTVSRLQEMGVERYQVASALLMILAQRLVRVLCPKCRTPYAARGDELHALGLGLEPGQTIYAAGACEECMGTGFMGRTGVFELLVMDEELRRLLGEGADEPALNALAEERGFLSYRYDGAQKVLAGITTVEEVLQAV